MLGSLPLTSADKKPGSGATEPNVPAGLGENRRMIPFFDVWLPEGLAFTPGSNGLVPSPFLGDGYVPAEKEVDNEVQLSPHGKESGH